MRPAFLYHGSKTLASVLEPRRARGNSSRNDQREAIYATHDRNFAIPFALPIVSDAEGKLGWSMSTNGPEPRILISAGILDLSAIGYLYRVPAESFEPIDQRQWVSMSDVVPIDYEVIQPAMYAGWIVERRTPHDLSAFS